MNDRYCFRQDDDGHWYLIEVGKIDMFEALLNKDDDYESFNENFSSIGCSPSCYSFKDPILILK